MANRITEFEPYAWPGGYDIAYIDNSGAVLCSDCAKAHHESDYDWEYIQASFCTADSDSCFTCEECGKRLGAYCDGETHSEYCDNWIPS